MAGHLKACRHARPSGDSQRDHARFSDGSMDRFAHRLGADSRLWQRCFESDVRAHQSVSEFTEAGLLGEFGGGTESRDDIPDQDGARLQAALWITLVRLPVARRCRGGGTLILRRGTFIRFWPRRESLSQGEDRRGRYGQWVKKMYDFGVEVSGIMDAQGGRFYVHNPEWVKTPEARKGNLLPNASSRRADRSERRSLYRRILGRQRRQII